MEYKEWILRFTELIDDGDTIFLSQMYTLMKRHLERKGTLGCGGCMDGLPERNSGAA